MTRSAPLLFVLVACSSPPVARIPPPPIANTVVAPPAKPPVCSAAVAQKLALQLGAAWKSAARTPPGDPHQAPDDSDPSTEGHAHLDGDNTAWIDLSCVGGQFGAPGYFVEAWDNRFVGTNRILVRHRAIVKLDGTALASAPDSDDPIRIDDHTWSYRALDLDGDGVDEIVVDHFFEHHALATSNSVFVLAVRAGKLVELPDQITYVQGGQQWAHCEGKLSVEHAGAATHLVATMTEAAAGSPDCLAVGRHEFALAGDHLVERR